jgi:hypothetical protein
MSAISYSFLAATRGQRVLLASLFALARSGRSKESLFSHCPSLKERSRKRFFIQVIYVLLSTETSIADGSRLQKECVSGRSTEGRRERRTLANQAEGLVVDATTSRLEALESLRMLRGERQTTSGMREKKTFESEKRQNAQHTQQELVASSR